MGGQKYPRKYKNAILEETQIRKKSTIHITFRTPSQGIGYIKNNDIYRKHASGASRKMKSYAETIQKLLKRQFV